MRWLKTPYLCLLNKHFVKPSIAPAKLSIWAMCVLHLKAEFPRLGNHKRFVEVKKRVGIPLYDFERVVAIMGAYHCIVAIAERLQVTQVCTFDRRDFTIIRPEHAPYFDLLPELYSFAHCARPRRAWK